MSALRPKQVPHQDSKGERDRGVFTCTLQEYLRYRIARDGVERDVDIPANEQGGDSNQQTDGHALGDSHAV